MKIYLSAANIELFRTSHYYSWNFWHKFGWFPDKDGSTLNADSNDFWMETDRELTKEEITEIKDFFDEKSTFLPPPHVQKVVLDLDYKALQTKISDYIKNDPTLDVKYVGEGNKQVLYCSRALTDSEQKKLRQLWGSMIRIE